jgi:hypothetical protein
MISRQIAAEGVTPIIVVTDEPEKYPANYNWAPGVPCAIVANSMRYSVSCVKSKACPR